jgi:hypothetical protein
MKSFEEFMFKMEETQEVITQVTKNINSENGKNAFVLSLN